MWSAEYHPYKSIATIKPPNYINATEDAAILRKAMKGFGTDGKAIIEVLPRRGCVQRLSIATSFKAAYGKDLVSDLKSELNGKFRDVILALMMPLPELYAKELHDALAGIGTDEEAIIEILCTLSNDGIKAIAGCYEQQYGRTIESDFKNDTSGHFKRLCLSLVQGNREECIFAGADVAYADAKALYDAGEGRWGTDESAFNKILVTRSYYHLHQVFLEYKKFAKHDIENAIKREFSGDIKQGLLAIVKTVNLDPIILPSVYTSRCTKSGLRIKRLFELLSAVRKST